MLKRYIKLSWLAIALALFFFNNTKAQFPITTNESEIGLILDCFEKAIQKTDTSGIYSMLGPQISVKGKTTDPRFQIRSILERAGQRKTIMSPSGVVEEIGNFWDLEIKVLEIKFANDSTEAVANCQLKLWAAVTDTPRTIKTTSESFKFKKIDNKGWQLVGFDNLFDFLEKEVNLGKHIPIPIPIKLAGPIPVKLTGSAGRPIIEALALKEGGPKGEGGYSDYALIPRKIFEPDVWRLTKGYTNGQWGIDLYAYPYSASQAYFFSGDDLLDAVMFITDYAWHRIVYIPSYSDYIYAFGSLGSDLGKFNSPSGIVVYNLPNDNIWNYYVVVADKYNHRIAKMCYYWPSEQITSTSEITGGGLAFPEYLDVNNGGRFGNASNHRIWVCNGDGYIKKFDLLSGNLLLEFGVGYDLQGIACGRSFFLTNPPYEHFANNNDIYVITGSDIHQYREDPPGNIQWIRTLTIAPTFPPWPPPPPWPIIMTSIDVDNFGQVWTTEVDTTDGSSVIVKYTPDLIPLCRFNAGGSFNYLQDFANTGGYKGCGNAFVIEKWENGSGGLYYSIGTDIINVSTGSNPEHWCHYIAYTLIDPALIAVKVYNQAGTFIKTVKDTINPYFPDFSGWHDYWWDGTDNSNHIVPSGDYRIEVTAYSGYTNINTGQPTNTVTRDGWVHHIDYTAPLSIPTITSISAIDTSICLVWDDNNSNELGYIIERKDATTGQWNVIDTTTWDVESYTDPQTMGSETYDYRIKAYNYFHTTGYSNTVTKRAHPRPPQIFRVENWYCNRPTWPAKIAPSEEGISTFKPLGNGQPNPDSIPSDLSVIYVDYPVNQKPGTYAYIEAWSRSCQWYNHFYVKKETTMVDLPHHRILIHTPPDTTYCSDWTYYFRVRTKDIYGDSSMFAPADWGWPFACIVGPCHVHFGPWPNMLKRTPTVFSLEQNYPNPFNPETQIRYVLPQATHVKLVLYNVLGQEVRTLVDEDQTPGIKTVRWDGKDENGKDVASGVYFYKIQAGNGKFSDVKKMVILK